MALLEVALTLVVRRLAVTGDVVEATHFDFLRWFPLAVVL